MAAIESLVDLSKMSSRNPHLVVKKAIEWVENNRNLGIEPLGLAWERLPTHGASTVHITTKGRERVQKGYDSPESWEAQLTLACWLYSIRGYVSLGNRAHILCTKSRSRGDIENSISTKHPKSKLQAKYDAILSDQNLMEDYRNEIMTERDIPEGLTPVQNELVVRSVNGMVSKSGVVEIKKSQGIDDVDLYNEWETMKLIPSINLSIIPTEVGFQAFSIHQLVEMLRGEGLAPALQKEIEALKEENSNQSKEIDRMRNRGLWNRILNR